MPQTLFSNNNVFFETFINNSLDFIFIVDVETTHLKFANETACKRLEYSIEELLDMPITQWRQPMKGDESYQEHIVKLMTETQMNSLGVLTCKDGSKIPVESKLKLVDFEGKKYNFVIARDITERLEIQNKKDILLISQALDSISDMAYLVDENGKIIYVNTAVTLQSGYSKQELYTKSITDIDPSFPSSKGASFWTELLKKRTIRLETINKRKNGTLYNIEIVASLIEINNKKYSLTIARNISERKAYEKTLIEEKKRSQHYLDIAGSIIVALNKEGVITLINQEGCNILEGIESQIVGKNWFDNFLITDDIEEIKNVFNQIINNEITNVQTFENKILTLTGQERDILWNNSIIYDDTGSIIGVLSSGNDVTEKKKIEQLLYLEQERFLTAIDGTKDGLWDWNTVTNEAYISNRYQTMLGYDVGELPFTSKAWSELIHPDDKKKAFKVVDEYFASKGKIEYKNTFRMRCKDGSYKWISGRGKAIFNEQGIPQRFIGFNTDITQEVEDKNELIQQKTFLRTIFETIPDMIWLKDPDGHYLACNPEYEKFIGFKEEKIIGKQDYVLIDKKVANRCRQHELSSITQNKTIVREELLNFSNDRHHELIEVSKTPMFDLNDHLIGVLGLGHIITKKRQVEERLQYALSGASDGLWDWNLETNDVYFSPRWLDMLGYLPGELPSHLDTWAKLVHPEDKETTLQIVDDYIHNRIDRYEIEFRMQHKDGHWVHILSRAKIPLDKDGNRIKPLRIVGTHVDITERWEHEQKLKQIAHYDSLTKLPNRLMILNQLRDAIKSANSQNKLLGILYLDLDGFKEINDTHGHDYGDKLLIEIAQIMKQALREGDTLGRLGGDEFVLILKDIETQDTVKPVLNRLLSQMSKPITIKNTPMQISASIGVTFYPQVEAVESDTLVRQADQAMYQAKQSGKNRYHIFDSEHDKTIRTHFKKLKQIHNGIKNNEFVLHYQPKVNMKTGEIAGVEALIRWQHPQRGLLFPADFLPDIENDQLIVDIGFWVIEEAMKQMSLWYSKGLKLPISVNISAKQLAQHDCVKQVRALINKYPIVTQGGLEFEILETSALVNIVEIASLIKEFESLGITFSLDDFGTGYSSLSYLKRLPAPILKIDRSFTIHMLNNPEDLAIIDGIHDLARAFNRSTIVEGVESILHGQILLLLGYQYAQGYVITKPLDVASLEAWLPQWKVPTKWLELSNVVVKDVSIIYALVEHRAWVQEVIDFCEQRKGQVPPTDPNNCKFGQWLMTKSHKEYFEELNTLHIDIHHYANHLLESSSDINNDMLSNRIVTLEEKLNHMIEFLIYEIQKQPAINK